MRYLKILFGILLFYTAYAGEVLFIATADLHGDIGAFARLAPVIRRYPEALKADAGDLIQGGYCAEKSAGQIMFDSLNALGYDVFVPGNHEFEFAPENFFRWSERFNGKILGVQWDYGNYSPRRYVVLQRGGYRIGVIGLGEFKLYWRQKYYPELHCRSHMAALRRTIDDIRKENCDAVILVCHAALGGPQGEITRILREFPEISAVVCAHSHREQPGTVVAGKLVIQPGDRSRSAALLTLHFSRDRRFQYASGRLLRPGRECDPEIMAIKSAAERRNSDAEKRILGNFISSGQFGSQAARALRKSTDTDAALVTYKKQDISGEISEYSLFNILPYRNRVWVVKMPLSEFKKLSGMQRRRGRSCFTDIAPGASGYIRAAIPDYILWQAEETMHITLEYIAGFERERIIGELEKSR